MNAADAAAVALEADDLERRFGGLRRLYGEAGYERLRTNVLSTFDEMDRRLTQPACSPAYLDEMRRIATLPGLAVYAAKVIHGSVPALAYRIELDGKAIALSGDGNGNNGNLEKLASDAEILVAHNAVPEGAEGVARALHMPPSTIGRIAQAAQVEKLVLSHRMLRTLGREAETRAAIAKSFSGEMRFADDLECFELD